MSEKMKILIGYDGSDCSDGALDDLQRAGLPADAEALVVSVAEVWLPPPPPSVYEVLEEAGEEKVLPELERAYAKRKAALDQALELAKRAANRVQTNFPEWKVSAEALSGSPAWELIFKADQWQPDLLVVGSHGHSVMSRLVVGSVSLRVVTEARCSVRVSRGRIEEPETPVRVVVGVDGSAGSETAVRTVAGRFWPVNSEVRLIVVDDPLIPGVITGLISPIVETLEENSQIERVWVEKILEQSAAILRGTKLNTTTEVREGDPKKVLVEVAEEWGADSICVGSTGFSNRLERFVLGSVSSAVVARAHCSVEVVRKTQVPLDPHSPVADSTRES